MSLFIRDLRGSLQKPDHWLYASWLDVITKYRKNYFGLVWIFFPPIVYIWGIGGYIGSLQPGLQLEPFLAHVGFGFIIYRFLSTVAVDATQTFAGYQSYIHDGNLRLTDFILRPLARSLIYFVFAAPLLAITLLGVMLGEGEAPGWLGVLASLAGLLVVLVNLLFYAVVLALLGARFPDLGEFAGSVVLAGFLLTPVVWYPELAPEGTVRGTLMRANPFHHLLAIVRAPVLGEALEQATLVYLAVMTVLGFALAWVGYNRFARRVPAWL